MCFYCKSKKNDSFGKAILICFLLMLSVCDKNKFKFNNICKKIGSTIGCLQEQIVLKERDKEKAKGSNYLVHFVFSCFYENKFTLYSKTIWEIS